jgi:Xaa-Pro aminopeptidase
MARAAAAAADDGLAGMLATPGPDLVYLTGYSPPAATERLTIFLNLLQDRRRILIVPTLERPDAERAPAALELVDEPPPTPPSPTFWASASPAARSAPSRPT